MVNWLEEVTSRKEALFEDLYRLLRIPSIREDDRATPEAPVGPGPKAALEAFIEMAKEDGFDTQQFGPWAGRVEIGQGDELLGILGHVDVVPIGTGWETDPFEPVLKNNRIYARGASDDKGPTVAAYFALKLLRDLGYKFNKRIHLIVGTDEESGWQCMEYYFKHAEMPDFGFSPDAVFPIINGEKGNVSFSLDYPSQNQPGEYRLVSFKGGLRENMVIQDCQAVLEGPIAHLDQDFDAFLSQHDEIQGSFEEKEGQLIFTLIGKAAHGSTPEVGINAATFLANFLKKLSYQNKASQDFLITLGDLFHLDFYAEKVGASYEHQVMGKVSMNVGIVNYESDKGQMVLNFRFPSGINPEMMVQGFERALSNYEVKVHVGESKEPHYVPADDPLVQTLLSVYEDQTGLKGHEMSIGGGTYGRLMPRGVAYGALFPNSIDTMHQANEFIDVDDLLKATAIYADAIYRLTR